MSMYNLIEYSDNYSKTSGTLWQYCKDIPVVKLVILVILEKVILLAHLNLKKINRSIWK